MKSNEKQIRNILKFALDNEMAYSLQYTDYEPNSWTMPAKLTPDRFRMLENDKSITLIKIVAVLDIREIDF